MGDRRRRGSARRVDHGRQLRPAAVACAADGRLGAHRRQWTAGRAYRLLGGLLPIHSRTLRQCGSTRWRIACVSPTLRQSLACLG
jgi:hypothetical protein